MEKEPLYSIVLLHYNQPNYVKQAIDSILMQDYENIELIFADDFSSKIDVQELKNYVEENKKSNIKKVIWQINSENMGTVKSLNSAILKCQGEYLLFFAADDMLCNKDVISNFVNAFTKVKEDVYMISSQCYMMDIKMKKELNSFVQPSFANSFNHFSSREQYKVFTKTCFLAIGATSMKMSMFEIFGRFNEKYDFVEDWSYFLHLTRNGGRIEYFDFDTLRHRDGGVSHYTDNQLVPKHVLAYKYDMVKILENEILPFIKDFSYQEIYNTIMWYDSFKNNYIASGGTKKRIRRIKIVGYYPLFWLKKYLISKKDGLEIKKDRYITKLKNISLIWLLFYIFYQLTSKELPYIMFPGWIKNILGALYLYIIPVIVVGCLLMVIFCMLLHGLTRLRNHIKDWFR